MPKEVGDLPGTTEQSSKSFPAQLSASAPPGCLLLPLPKEGLYFLGPQFWVQHGLVTANRGYACGKVDKGVLNPSHLPLMLPLGQS